MSGVVCYCLCQAWYCSEVELGEVGCGMMCDFRCGLCDFCQFVPAGVGQHVVKGMNGLLDDPI